MIWRHGHTYPRPLTNGRIELDPQDGVHFRRRGRRRLKRCAGQSYLRDRKSGRWRMRQDRNTSNRLCQSGEFDSPDDIRLRALQPWRRTARMRGRHLYRTTLITHISAAFILGRAKALRDKTRKAWCAKQDQQSYNSSKFASQPHRM